MRTDVSMYEENDNKISLSTTIKFDYIGNENGIPISVIQEHLKGLESFNKDIELYFNSMLEKAKIDAKLKVDDIRVVQILRGSFINDIYTDISILTDPKKRKKIQEAFMKHPILATAIVGAPIVAVITSMILGSGASIGSTHISTNGGDVFLSSFNDRITPEETKIAIAYAQEQINEKFRDKKNTIAARKLLMPAKCANSSIIIGGGDDVIVIPKEEVTKIPYEDAIPEIKYEEKPFSKTLVYARELSTISNYKKWKIELPLLNPIEPKKLYDARLDKGINLENIQKLDFFADIEIQTKYVDDNISTIQVVIKKIY